MSARAFADGVNALLAQDTIFVAAIASLLGVPITGVLRGNVPLVNIPTGNLPCFVIEQGDGTSASISNNGDDGGHVIGLGEQQFRSDLHVSLIWNEQDRERAASQRSDLPTLMAQLMLRNPMPGGIDFGTLTEWEPDRGVNHPLQVWRCTLTGEYAIPKS